MNSHRQLSHHDKQEGRLRRVVRRNKWGTGVSPVPIRTPRPKVGAQATMRISDPDVIPFSASRYEGAPVPGQAFGKVAFITSSSSLLSAGF